MSEQVFRSPGFFDREIELIPGQVSPSGTPAGIIGTAEKGPAFVPVTVATFEDFVQNFGNLNPERFGPYAVKFFLDNRNALTYMRVLGAGSNLTDTQINTTIGQGTVTNAGFAIKSGSTGDGNVQFLCAAHNAVTNETAGFPVFTDNDSINNPNSMNLVRGVIFTASGSRLLVANHNTEIDFAYLNTPIGNRGLLGTTSLGNFKLIISTSLPTYATTDTLTGIRVLTASLNPASSSYFGRILNTDPLRFHAEQHLLYLDFPVENDLAEIPDGASVALVTGSAIRKSSNSALADTPIGDLFGRYDTRYKTPKTTNFISQPFGKREYDLFKFETISDGAYGNNKYKVSIANIQVSTDPKLPFGKFEVQVRDFNDNDIAPRVVERFVDCNLDQKSEKYIARVIGDRKVFFNHDAVDVNERRLMVKGNFQNKSRYVRVLMSEEFENGQVPNEAVPFGFRGAPVIKTSDSLTDSRMVALSVGGHAVGHVNADLNTRLTGSITGLTGSIVPPLPMTFKVTRGNVDSSSPTFTGAPGDIERVDPRIYWGVKTTIVPRSDSNLQNTVLDTNGATITNRLVEAYTKFQGLDQLDVLVSGSALDAFNNNKFSLAKVALYNTGDVSVVTGTANEHMLDAAYIRNGVPDATTYKITDDVGSRNRITLATLANSSSVKFNKFAAYNKFTNIFYGGFDGTNILDKDNFYLNDRASSADAGGKANTTWLGGLAGLNGTGVSGFEKENNIVNSYKHATEIMTDPVIVANNILTIPGIREPFITDDALDKMRNYSLGFFILDAQAYDDDGNRLYHNSITQPSVKQTVEQFETRLVDNSYAATYFPDIRVKDDINRRVVKVPSSVAALSALGYTDKVSFPWFAPAGFSRGALEFVDSAEIPLNKDDKDSLYDARINPISTFPKSGYVITGQKTLQSAASALDRVNVRRMLLEIKRLVSSVGNRFLFEPNIPATRSRFVNQLTPLLSIVQAQQGIERFQIVVDGTNNTFEDEELNRLNGRIVLVPTKAIEFIAVDFIIDAAGISFV